ncbi:MAG TPA: hypothetical protein H9854_05460, partial [Candidatus Halomonas stercoripullorum]|nr:hypothetical protein [Candidatus Halomonas stercoripullorum]
RIGLSMRLDDQPDNAEDSGSPGVKPSERRAGRGKAPRRSAPSEPAAQEGQMGALGAALLKARKGRS